MSGGRKCAWKGERRLGFPGNADAGVGRLREPGGRITIDQLVELYDGLTRDQVIAVLDFAARSLDEPALAR